MMDGSYSPPLAQRPSPVMSMPTALYTRSSDLVAAEQRYVSHMRHVQVTNAPSPSCVVCAAHPHAVALAGPHLKDARWAARAVGEQDD